MTMGSSSAAEKKISSAFIYFFGSFGGILFGYDIGVMTGALPFLQNDWGLAGNASIIGWITSSVMFGAIFGGALAGQLSDKLGRRKMILLSALIFVVGSILSGLAPQDGSLYLIAVRVLLGLAVGAASALVPAYMSEMSPARLRGRLSGINQTMIVSGMLLSYVVDFLLKDMPETIAWRLMLSLAAFQQFQGANAIFYYIPLIVEQATGQAASSQLMWPIIQGILLVLGSLVFLAIADRFKRRTLLTLGGTVMGLSFILPAVINSIVPDTDPMMIVGFLCVYVAFYSFTWAPLTWVIVGEIFPLAIRGRASGMASSFNWIGSFLVGLLFPIMTASISQAAVFAIFGCICLLGVAFIRNCVPETRGATLEEIEAAGIAHGKKDEACPATNMG